MIRSGSVRIWKATRAQYINPIAAAVATAPVSRAAGQLRAGRSRLVMSIESHLLASG
jgi:hypothetical protein